MVIFFICLMLLVGSFDIACIVFGAIIGAGVGGLFGKWVLGAITGGFCGFLFALMVLHELNKLLDDKLSIKER